MTTTGADFIAAALALAVAGITGTIASCTGWQLAVTRPASATIHPTNRTSSLRVIVTIGRAAVHESAGFIRVVVGLGQKVAFVVGDTGQKRPSVKVRYRRRPEIGRASCRER